MLTVGPFPTLHHFAAHVRNDGVGVRNFAMNIRDDGAGFIAAVVVSFLSNTRQVVDFHVHVYRDNLISTHPILN